MFLSVLVQLALFASLLASLLPAKAGSTFPIAQEYVLSSRGPYGNQVETNATVCVIRQAACIDKANGFFVAGDPKDYSCSAVQMVSRWGVNSSFIPNFSFKSDNISWSDKTALIFKRFWPENTAHALLNDVVSLLITWHRVHLFDWKGSTQQVPKLKRDVVQVITLDTYQDHHNHLKHVYAELGLGKLIQPNEFPSETLCFKTAILGSGLFQPEGSISLEKTRATADDVRAVKTFVRDALALPPVAPHNTCSRVTFLTRKFRLISNEDEIKRKLSAIGYHISAVDMDCSRCSFRDQLLSVLDADVIISIHGAQLSYALFCDDGIGVVEVQRLPNRFFSAASVLAQQVYARVVSNDSTLNITNLPSDEKESLEHLQQSNATLFDVLLREHICPLPGWPLECRAALLDVDVHVDPGRILDAVEMMCDHSKLINALG